MLSIAYLCGCCPAAWSAPTPVGDASKLIDDSDPGWSWSGMVRCDDPGLTGGTGHAGGPGSYGVYSFTGSSVEVYVFRGSDVTVGDRVHKVGRLKVSIDGVSNGAISLARPSTGYNYCAFSQSGLTQGHHELRVEPDAGWVVVDYIRVTTDGMSSTGVNKNPTDGPSEVLFQSKGTPLTRSGAVDGCHNVVGFNADIGPELQVGKLPQDWGITTILAHSGDDAIRYSGSAVAGDGDTFCYMLAYLVSLPIQANTSMTYWILPQQDNGRYVAVDLHCTDGTVLSRLDATDQNNVSMSPLDGHGGALPLYAWTLIRCHIGQWLAGKTVDKIWIGFARAGAVGKYRGYIDDLSIYDGKP